jgi:hypothetical protein
MRAHQLLCLAACVIAPRLGAEAQQKKQLD